MSWSIAHIWQAHFATADGVQNYPLSVGAFYLLRPLVTPQSLPFLLAPALLVGIMALQAGAGGAGGAGGDGLRGNASRPLLLLLLTWWLVPAIFLSGIAFESARFALIYALPLAILEAIGLVAAVLWLQRFWRGARHAGVVVALLSLGILGADVSRPLGALASGKTGDLAAVRWLMQHAPHGATLVTFSLTLTLYHNGDLPRHDWTLLDLSAVTPADLQRLARTRPLIVIVNEPNLAAQWPGLPPETAFLWLSEHVRLRPVAHVGGYTMLTR